MTDLNEIMKSYEEHRRKEAGLIEANKGAVFDALSETAITRVHLEFDGCSDSGQLEPPIAYAGEDRAEIPQRTVAVQCLPYKATEPAVSEQPLSQAIEDLCYAILEAEFSGWENNDGAYGNFVLDVAERRVTLKFEQRYTDTTSYTREF